MTRCLPGGPRGVWWATLRYGADPYGYVGRCAGRFGDRFTLPLITGPVLVTGRPEDAQAFFGASGETFGVWAKAQIEPVFGAESIFVASGSAHKAHRRAVVPALKGGFDVLGFAAQSAARLARGEVLDVGAWALSLTLRAITGAVLGREASEAEQALLTRYVQVSGSDGVMAALLWPRLRRRWYGPWRRLLEAQVGLRAWLDEALPGSPFEARCGGLSAGAARDDLLTILIAGYESTAHALAWALDCLHHHPAVLAKLRAELPNTLKPEALDGLPYLDAVCQETLRLHPVVVQVTRTLQKPLQLGDYQVPAGVSVSPAARLLHHNPAIYEDPAVFRPERFVERRFRPCEHISFGGGLNRCPGAGLALRTMKQGIYALLSQRTLEAVGPPVSARVRGLVMVPVRAIRLRVVQ